MTERLGPPPHDLDGRDLSIVRLEGPWLRLHAARREPVFFGKTGLNRFDDPEGEYGVLYVAEDAFGAFIEVYGRDPGLNLVAEMDPRGRVLSELAVEGELRLVDLTGRGRRGSGRRARSRRTSTSWCDPGHALSSSSPLRLRKSTTGSSTTSIGRASRFSIGRGSWAP